MTYASFKTVSCSDFNGTYPYIRSLGPLKTNSKPPLLQRAKIAFDQQKPVPGLVTSIESSTSLCNQIRDVRYTVYTQGFCMNYNSYCDVETGYETPHSKIIENIEALHPYYTDHNGYVIISGGEPMMQPHFTASVLDEARDMGLTTVVDTTGQIPSSWNTVLPRTDRVTLCIKHMDPDKYYDLTGFEQEHALEFAKVLGEEGIPVQIRYIIIPGLTDDHKNLRQLALWAKQQKTLTHLELVPYHNLGFQKWQEVDNTVPLKSKPVLDKKRMHSIARVLSIYNFRVICS
ncbi:pyruvate formate-lyase 1-activating enzyme [Tetraselmis virus 1]|uniref:Pyruvate formate-lyase 1-activating enzyme n=1 Tax=Tetraselmis virus 1 TaxID=2060617 RepID=A0A2P0VNQ0_9VIRU|nr:pyruvate formate-lyase 1-activating enzyme [Tetraselmis virus 1]AUF82538.1 pyruvate formate-lyase 1-activating enzyme [Tetraselmis virus 1]